MSVKITGTVENPSSIVVSLELTMTIGEWSQIADALKDAEYWPCGRLAAAVRDLIRKLTSQVSDRVEPAQ